MPFLHCCLFDFFPSEEVYSWRKSLSAHDGLFQCESPFLKTDLSQGFILNVKHCANPNFSWGEHDLHSSILVQDNPFWGQTVAKFFAYVSFRANRNHLSSELRKTVKELRKSKLNSSIISGKNLAKSTHNNSRKNEEGVMVSFNSNITPLTTVQLMRVYYNKTPSKKMCGSKKKFNHFWPFDPSQKVSQKNVIAFFFFIRYQAKIAPPF